MCCDVNEYFFLQIPLIQLLLSREQESYPGIPVNIFRKLLGTVKPTEKVGSLLPKH